VNPFIHNELIRLHQDDLRRAADRHRLAAHARGSLRRRRPRVTQLLARLTPRQLRRVAQAEPCVP
jgi:hypothetical protein